MKQSWILLSLVSLSACGDSVESSVQPEGVAAEVLEEGVEKEIQQGGLVVRTSVIPESLRLGDPFQLKLFVEGPSEIEIEMPPFGEALGRLTIVDFTPKQSTTDKNGQRIQTHTQTYGLQPNRSGEVVVPALRIGYRININAPTDWEEVLTEPIPIQVASILPTDGDLVYQSSRRRLDPLPVEQPWVPWAVGAAGTGILMFVGVWWFGRQQGTSAKVSAFQQAMQQLRRLQDDIATLTDEDSVDDLYAGLSVTLRGYLEGCFQVSALEQTTEELRQSLSIDLKPYIEIVSKEHIVEILQVLSLCDGVKFAGQVRTISEVQSDWSTVQQLVQVIHDRSLIATDNGETNEAKDGLV